MRKILVFQSDFGLSDGAVAAMYGVALDVDPELKIFDLTHDITPYNTWEASYRLFQAATFWPGGTVFVSVVDPGVGTDRKSVVALTKKGHYIVTPDNGTLTHIKNYVGITEVRVIDESKHRRSGSLYSNTFHGRDVFAVVGAKLASGKIGFDDIGEKTGVDNIIELELSEVTYTENGIKGCIDILDVRFGSLWTNIRREDFVKMGFKYGDRIEVVIKNGPTLVYNNRVTYGKSFGDVYVSEPVIYVNSLDRMAVAINQGNFAKAYSIGTGRHWTIEFKKAD
ncbi:DNA-directed RNA polymerase subunit delta [Thermoclostridium stercorarium subsp. thermolacticum DSM 2910]|jgi:S-adenosylmethionine hydrolase|uniref:DNA-directed RNA polymerase subunit delta n=1 Tax=Thermoclostridium stercorarium subsp. thermolacticum DSM 2910 TaxID=1121336 RepID=A0A1B1YFL0_THEST|nr:S-adenosyl-l-methionine hydroxide adenosyltransferase family protein [Thermoclostridium stercorarium]ANW99523.1 DNA-directed RNA polymerase subunit delta [Thermoclostridium stercorarium subsp. thermolacticum DSM 2910]UZQ85220.1 S-adenosyl-l-methionine hydroxide adenosyltransferase family protein [Thermoclostridium stercorarium]